MKRTLIIGIILLTALQAHSQVVLDKVEALFSEVKTFRSAEEVFVRNTPDSLIYYLYIDVYEQPNEKHRNSQLCHEKAMKQLKTLGKMAQVQMHWKSEQEESEMWYMTFSDRENLRFELKPLQVNLQQSELRYQIPQMGGWLVYTYVKSLQSK